ncbi:PepSY domain-containing protein [Lysobacter cavernae]|uniref:PepSY domain-containing protein n=1 Tax=Lysobacter cavernae TaxID=1685901 RepID=A0ABV7RRR1_9GAMM
MPYCSAEDTRQAMKTLFAPAIALSLLAVSAVAGGDAWAQDRGQDRSRDRDRSGSGHDRREDQRELSDAVRRVERRTGGQVLSAERVPYDGRDVNRVKVVDSSGRVRVYMDDPQSRGRGDDNRTRRDDD